MCSLLSSRHYRADSSPSQRRVSQRQEIHSDSGCTVVIFVHGWIPPFRMLKLLVAPHGDQREHYKQQYHVQDAPMSVAQHVGGVFAKVVRKAIQMAMNCRRSRALAPVSPTCIPWWWWPSTPLHWTLIKYLHKSNLREKRFTLVHHGVKVKASGAWSVWSFCFHNQ